MLQNLELDVESLLHGLPLAPVRAFAGTLRLDIPWTAVTTQPTRVHLENVEVVLETTRGPDGQGERRHSEPADGAPAPLFEDPPPRPPVPPAAGSSSLSWFGIADAVASVVRRMEVSVSNLVLRIVHQGLSVVVLVPQLAVDNAGAGEGLHKAVRVAEATVRCVSVGQSRCAGAEAMAWVAEVAPLLFPQPASGPTVAGQGAAPAGAGPRPPAAGLAHGWACPRLGGAHAAAGLAREEGERPCVCGKPRMFRSVVASFRVSRSPLRCLVMPARSWTSRWTACPSAPPPTRRRHCGCCSWQRPMGGRAGNLRRGIRGLRPRLAGLARLRGTGSRPLPSMPWGRECRGGPSLAWMMPWGRQRGWAWALLGGLADGSRKWWVAAGRAAGRCAGVGTSRSGRGGGSGGAERGRERSERLEG